MEMIKAPPGLHRSRLSVSVSSRNEAPSLPLARRRAFLDYVRVIHSRAFSRSALAAANTASRRRIYKFEKIKRAKRAAMAAHPGAEIIDLGVGEPDEMAFPEVVEKLCAEARKPENRGYADNGDAVLKAGGGPLPGTGVRRQGHQPGDGSAALDRQQGGALDPAGGAHQPGRLRADDRAGLPGLRHARQVPRRAGPQSAADGGEPVSAGPGFRARGGAEAGQGAGAELSQQPDRRQRDAGVLRAGGRVRADATASSSSTMRPTRRWCSKAGH